VLPKNSRFGRNELKSMRDWPEFPHLFRRVNKCLCCVCLSIASLPKKRRPKWVVGKKILERRWSSHRFSYSYLVTTSPQSSTIPSAPASLAG